MLGLRALVLGLYIFGRSGVGFRVWGRGLKDYGLGLRDSGLRVICPQPKWSRV